MLCLRNSRARCSSYALVRPPPSPLNGIEGARHSGRDAGPRGPRSCYQRSLSGEGRLGSSCARNDAVMAVDRQLLRPVVYAASRNRKPSTRVSAKRRRSMFKGTTLASESTGSGTSRR